MNDNRNDLEYLKQEYDNYLYFAQGLDLEHQKNLRQELLAKCSNIKYQIEELEKK